MARSSRDRARNAAPRRAKARPAGADATDSGAAEAGSDLAWINGPSGDGRGLDIVRLRADRIELGTLRPLAEGQPIQGEVISLKPRPNLPLLCDVEVVYAPPKREQAASAATAENSGAADGGWSGPSQVATESYRKNWDAVFGRRRKLAN